MMPVAWEAGEGGRGSHAAAGYVVEADVALDGVGPNRGLHEGVAGALFRIGRRTLGPLIVVRVAANEIVGAGAGFLG